MTKSFVTMEQHICPVCGVTHDTGALLMDKRLRDKFEKNTVTGTSLCPEHQQKFDEGYIALIEIDPSKSGQADHYGKLKPDYAYRTGVIAHMKREVFEQVFDASRAVDDKGNPLAMVFIDPEVTAMLQKMTGKSE